MVLELVGFWDEKIFLHFSEVIIFEVPYSFAVSSNHRVITIFLGIHDFAACHGEIGYFNKTKF